MVVVPPSVSASLPPSEPAEPLAREEDPWRGATPSAARGEWLRGDRWPRRLLRGLWDRLDRGDLDLRRRDTRGDTVCRRVPDPALSAGGAAAPAALLWSFTRPTPAPAALAVVASAGVASMSLTDRRGRVRPACGSAPLLPRGDMPRLGWRCTGAVAASVGSRAASCGTHGTSDVSQHSRQGTTTPAHDIGHEEMHTTHVGAAKGLREQFQPLICERSRALSWASVFTTRPGVAGSVGGPPPAVRRGGPWCHTRMGRRRLGPRNTGASRR